MFPGETHTLKHSPKCIQTRGALISLTHEASFLGHQLTEAGLGRDGAQEVSHCPAAEPAAWVLQSPFLPPPHLQPPPPLFPALLKQPFHMHPAFRSLRRLIRCTAALCGSSITGHEQRNITPLLDRNL